MKFKMLYEKRKNAELNPKISAYKYLKPYSKRDDIYIHFTDINKLGVNPKTNYDTPVGIYTYSLKEAWSEIEKFKSMDSIPFAGNRKHIVIIEAIKGKSIPDLNKYTKSQYDIDRKILVKKFSEKKVTIIEKALLPWDSFGQLFWDLTSMICDSTKNKFNKKTSLLWHNLLKNDLKYTYIGDKTGGYVIRHNEGRQTVFFDKKSTKVIDVIPNKNFDVLNMNGGEWTEKDGPWKGGFWQDGIFNGGVWEEGTWQFGIWEDGIHEAGTWKDGDWLDGIWEYGTWEYGTWKDGVWKDGIWKSGLWKNGIWKDGTFKNGGWKKGTWEDGIWEYGFHDNGIWQNGVWHDGLWNGGTWEDGTWLGGTWKGGKWLGGYDKNGTMREEDDSPDKWDI